MACQLNERPIVTSRTMVGFGLEEYYGKRQDTLREMVINFGDAPYQPASYSKGYQPSDAMARENIPLGQYSSMSGGFWLYATSGEPSWIELLEASGYLKSQNPYLGGTLLEPKQHCKSITTNVLYQNVNHVIAGSRFNLSFSGAAGNPVNVSIDGRGLRAMVESEVPEMDMESISDHYICNNIGFSILRKNEAPIIPIVKDFDIDLGVRFFERRDGDDSGGLSEVMVQYLREPSWSVNVEFSRLIDWNQLYEDGELYKLSLTLTDEGGSTVTFFTDDDIAKLDNIPPFGNISGIRSKGLNFKLLGDSGLKILFKQ